MNIGHLPRIGLLVCATLALYIGLQASNSERQLPSIQLEQEAGDLQMQTTLQIIPGRYPSDLVSFFGDTLLVDSCLQFSGLVFDATDVEEVGSSTPGLQISMETNPPSQFDFFQGTNCFGELPTVTWYGIDNSGGAPDTVATLSYRIAQRSKFIGFSPQLATLLNVPVVQPGGVYEVCDTSLFNNPFLDEFASFQICNATVKVSSGRKKLNLKGEGNPAVKDLSAACDTFQITWTPIDTVANDTCAFTESVSVFLKYCPTNSFLQLIPDSFPDYVEFRNDTIIVNSNCIINTDLVFDENDVQWVGSCSPNAQIQVGFSNITNPFQSLTENIFDYFFSGVCANDSLPVITWYGVVDNGSVLDTVASLPLKLTDTRIWGFTSEFADLLGVDTVLNGDEFALCNDSIFQDSFAVLGYVNFQECNTSVKVSTGRKKLNFKENENAVKSNSTPCDTFLFEWFPVVFNTNDTCDFYKSNTVSLNVVFDETAPTFSSIPPDITIPSGTPPTFGTPIAEDNCVTPDVTFIDDTQTNGNSIVYTRTWTASDGCQTTTASQSITATTSDITLSCPDNIVVATQSGASGVAVTWPTPQATTPCTTGTTSCQPENIPGFNLIGELNGKIYYISTVDRKWVDAQSHCETNGGHLAIVNTPAKQDFLKNAIGFFNAAFIGLNDNSSEGDFQWSDGSQFSYQNWQPGQPDGGTNENYVAMHGWSNGRWADYNFWTHKKYILEKSCTGGSDLDIQQVTGPPSGSLFPPGETIITYQATDACGNTGSCSFTITVEINDNGDCDKNLALNKVAKQSSTRAGGLPDRAVDGNTNGNFYQDYSVALTEWEDNPWWEVDLVKPKFIDHINLWNRTDCCSEHTSAIYLLVSENPFISEDLDEVLAQHDVSSYYLPDQVGLPTTVSVGREGRYVRVQMNKQSFLSLAEVEIFGCEDGNITGTPPSVYFDAKMENGKNVVLHWMESSPEGKAYFSIEKSTDRIHFEKLHDPILPAENSRANTYQRYDSQPTEGENYYRLKTVFKNGGITYSEIKKIEFNLDGNFGLFPNPTKGQVRLYLERFIGKDVTVLISNPFGQPIFEQSVNNLQQEVLPINLHQMNIRDGVYFVSVIHKGRALTKRMIVVSP
jgi:hypothetical protein